VKINTQPTTANNTVVTNKRNIVRLILKLKLKQLTKKTLLTTDVSRKLQHK